MINNEAILKVFLSIADQKGWRQFHTPKNLASALSVEASELLEIHQWDSDDSVMSEATKRAAAGEAADVLMYLLAYADKVGIDLAQAAREKARINEQRLGGD